MKTKVGFIVKSKINGKTIFNHLLSNEINLISKISGESDNKEIEVKKVFFTDEDQFTSMKF
jgi:hypothetical protein